MWLWSPKQYRHPEWGLHFVGWWMQLVEKEDEEIHEFLSIQALWCSVLDTLSRNTALFSLHLIVHEVNMMDSWMASLLYINQIKNTIYPLKALLYNGLMWDIMTGYEEENSAMRNRPWPNEVVCRLFAWNRLGFTSGFEITIRILYCMAQGIPSTDDPRTA